LIFEWNYGLIAVPFKEAGVAKLADAPDLGSGGEILRGSSPLSGKRIGSRKGLASHQPTSQNAA
jgi:hypothetical protein